MKITTFGILFTIVFIIFMSYMVNASPFDSAWTRQTNRTTRHPCDIKINDGNTVTGELQSVTWIHPYCENNKCWGIKKKTQTIQCVPNPDRNYYKNGTLTYDWKYLVRR